MGLFLQTDSERLKQVGGGVSAKVRVVQLRDDEMESSNFEYLIIIKMIFVPCSALSNKITSLTRFTRLLSRSLTANRNHVIK